MATTIFHNTLCSKSRAALAFLMELGGAFEVVEYLREPPSAETLDEICTKLSMEPQALIRTGESLFSELGLSIEDDRSRADWLQLLADNPVLIERPIVVHGDRAAIGRPLDKVATLFE